MFFHFSWHKKKREKEKKTVKKMKENFPNLAKETDFQEVQEAQRVPKKLDRRRNTPCLLYTSDAADEGVEV